MTTKYLAISVPGFNPIDPPDGKNIPNGNIEKLSTIINNGISLALFAIVTLSLIFLIIGGIQWIMSGGDKAKVQGARNRMTYAIIGLVVALLAFAIINFVGYLFNLNFLLQVGNYSEGT